MLVFLALILGLNGHLVGFIHSIVGNYDG